MSNQNTNTQSNQQDIDVDLGNHEIVIKQRYEFYFLVNDIFIGIWFVVGSILFLWESTTMLGTWLFIIGSLEFLARPVIRTARSVHLQRIGVPASDSYTNNQKISSLRKDTQQKVEQLEQEIEKLKNDMS